MSIFKPDFSDYVVHFTKNRSPEAKDPEGKLSWISKMTAPERLTNIIKTGKISATPMPWTGAEAVAFTECTWASLIGHAQRYSPFGIGFSKAFLFAAGGGPVFYLRPDVFKHQKEYVQNTCGSGSSPFTSHLLKFVTPFAPPYSPPKFKDAFWPGKKSVDYSHEREWRVPHELTFEIRDIAFVVVDTYKDMAALDKQLKDQIGRDNFLIMSNYRRIEELWPIHRQPA